MYSLNYIISYRQKTLTYLTGLLLKNHDWWPESIASFASCVMPQILDLNTDGMSDVLKTALHYAPLSGEHSRPFQVSLQKDDVKAYPIICTTKKNNCIQSTCTLNILPNI